jgi:hypothetical protein
MNKLAVQKRLDAMIDKCLIRVLAADQYSRRDQPRNRANLDGRHDGGNAVLEPISEAGLLPEQYAYRPGRNTQQAVAEVGALLHRGHRNMNPTLALIHFFLNKRGAAIP